MKGIILAGGSGSRLFPLTKVISKQLLPIYDKPMIYYPLSVLILGGIIEILIISTTEDLESYKKLLGNGNRLGIKLSYIEQPSPDGLAQAFILGERFIENDSVSLILGDNIFYGQALEKTINQAVCYVTKYNMATIIGLQVKNPERFGVLQFDQNNNVLAIEEKPAKPKSNFAVTGLYFYPNDVIKKSLKIKPSERNELEITDLNIMFLKENRLKLIRMTKDFTWLDTGTHESLLEASMLIKAIEDKHGIKVGCIEEIAYKKGHINQNQLFELSKILPQNHYKEYLLALVGALSWSLFHNLFLT